MSNQNNKSMLSYIRLPLYVAAFYLFLYVPIIVLICFSFNKSSLSYVWESFSIYWYKELFHSLAIWRALKTSIIVACSSVFLSLVMSVLLVIYMVQKGFEKILIIYYGTLLFPEIVLGVGLLSMFMFFSVPLGITTLIAGHTVLGLSYAVPIIYARYKEISAHLIEASLDLGATYMQTFFKITLPLLRPAIFAAGLLVFIISFDEFLISFFCSDASSQTLTLYIFSMIYAGVSPVVNALSTCMLLVTSIIVLFLSSINIRTRIF